EFWYYILFPLLLLPFYAESRSSRLKYLGLLFPVVLLLATKPRYYALFVVWLLGVAARRINLPIRNSAFAFAVFCAALINSRVGIGSFYIRGLLVGLGAMLFIIAVMNGGRGVGGLAGFSKKMAGFSYT